MVTLYEERTYKADRITAQLWLEYNEEIENDSAGAPAGDFDLVIYKACNKDITKKKEVGKMKRSEIRYWLCLSQNENFTEWVVNKNIQDRMPKHPK